MSPGGGSYLHTFRRQSCILAEEKNFSILTRIPYVTPSKLAYVCDETTNLMSAVMSRSQLVFNDNGFS